MARFRRIQYWIRALYPLKSAKCTWCALGIVCACELSTLQICRVWAAWSPWYSLRLRVREELVEGALDEALETLLEGLEP